MAKLEKDLTEQRQELEGGGGQKTESIPEQTDTVPSSATVEKGAASGVEEGGVGAGQLAPTGGEKEQFPREEGGRENKLQQNGHEVILSESSEDEEKAKTVEEALK